MTDPVEPTAAAVEETIDPKPVEALFQAMVKGARAAQLYLPNNPVYHQAAANLQEAFTPVWALTQELSLAVKETTFVLGQHVVLDQPQKSDSMAWLLYKDGVRTLVLVPGAEEEIVRLVSVLNTARNLPPDADDDLLTLLWEQEFQFINYNYVELATDDAKPLEEGQEEAELGQERSRDAQ